MATINDGGAAFPREDYQLDSGLGQSGMSLRDYFAAKALAGAFPEFLRAGEAWDGYDDLAASCYRAADAMIKAREAHP